MADQNICYYHFINKEVINMKKLTLLLKLLFLKSLKHKNKLTRNIENWKVIYESEIKKLGLKPNQLKAIGQSLYIKKLEQVISDSDITEVEKAELEEIVIQFGLDPKFLKSAKASINEKAVKKLVAKQYEDKILTEEEKKFIIDFATYLEFDHSKIEKIRHNVASSLLKAALNDKLKDKKLSPKEETELNQTLRNLQIDEVTLKSMMTKNTLQNLAYAKLLWQLENGIFTIIHHAPINLTKNEKCYLSFQGKVLESKIVTTGYTRRSSGVSIKIAKGVTYRVGAARSAPIREEITVKHSGNLYLTSSRIVFVAGSKSFIIKFDDLLTFEVYSNGIGFVVGGHTHLVELNSQHVELFGMGLTSSMRNYIDGNNGIFQNALREIDDNEKFINIS
jgi:hypothetical protein